ncbi:MAG: alkaline phosphatase PhoX [Chloroflexota bacterium]
MKKRLLIASLLLLLAVKVSTVRADGPAFPEFPKDNPYAAFINSRGFAIEKGATAEWRKMEGVALDTKNKHVYFAITAIAKGMSDDKGDLKMKENLCGAVMMGQLDDSYNISSLTAVVIGGPYDKTNKDYACSADSIANPDNLFVDPKGNLWIGEDTDYHHNQMLWMWDGKELKRFATLPEGAESTGLRVEANGTVFSNIQHPNATNVYPFNRGVVGVVTDFKAGDDFKAVPVPTGDAMKQMTLAAGNYQVLGRTGEAIPGALANATFGQIMNANGTLQGYCNNPDGNMFLPTNAAGSEGYLYTNWECTPGAESKLYIKQGSDGKWSTIEGQPVDMLRVGGNWNNCNASVTPWNTGLTSEEYPADVQDEWDGGWVPVADQMSAVLGHAANPYNYGYMVELTPAGGESDGIGTIVTKHYAMGRFSHENADIMPDQKTAYFGDDGTDRVLYKFVADKEGDLSAGTLFAAKVTQDGEKLNLEWIKLGSGNDTDIAKAVEDLAPKK